jgi:N-acetylmuramoyl-L-alanine amidase
VFWLEDYELVRFRPDFKQPLAGRSFMATGKEMVKTALKHLGERYVLGAIAPKNDPDWDGPWDCAEFVSWCVYQIAGILYGCEDNRGNPAQADAFTGFWGRDARSMGKQISVAQAAKIPGAAVLRLGPKMGHIVISDGRGGTVEAHSSGTGVICHTLSERRWDMGILVPGIRYEENGGEVDPTPPGFIYRLTTPFMRGKKILEIQEKLDRLGYDPGSVDGIFGPRTLTAVLSFQQARGLVADGEVGRQTARALGVTLRMTESP